MTASGVGIIVGAGIYVLIGAATREAGASVWLAFVVAATLSAFTGLSYAELASMFPRAGAEYEYARVTFGRRTAFVVGWVMVAGLVVAAAAVSIGFARYLGQFVDVPVTLGAFALLAMVWVIASAGIQNSVRLTVVLSCIQVGGLLFVIAIGSGSVGDVNLLAGNGTMAVFGAAALVFFAFIGFDEVITLSEETKNPTKTVPRALLAALGISTLLYAGVAIVAVSVLGVSALAASERPLADVIDAAFGGPAVSLVAAIAMVSTTNTTLLATTAASRLLYGMSGALALPPFVGAVSKRSGAPIRALAICCIIAGVFVFFGELETIASVTDAAVYFEFIAVNASVIVLRRRSPGASRPFRTPGSIGWMPIVPVLGILITLLLLTQLERTALALAFGLVLLGVLAMLLMDNGPPWNRPWSREVMSDE